MHIARLQAHHAQPYRSLMLEAYELAADAFTSTTPERAHEPESYWVRRIADPTGLSAAFGAFDGERLVGTVAVEYSAKPKTLHKGLVIGMYVAPAARGQRVGQALLAAVVQHARARAGMRLLTLTVTEGNAPALQLYRNAGFQAFGTEPMAILTPTGYQAKVHMALTLDEAGQPAPGSGRGAAAPLLEKQLWAQPADGPAWPMTLRIWAPTSTGPQGWSCAVEADHLFSPPRPIHGADAWQALQLAMAFAATLLHNFQARGGTLYWPPGEDSAQLEAFQPDELLPVLAKAPPSA